MQARLLSKKPCSVTFSSHSCLRTEEIKQAWVFLEGKLCLSLVARVRWCVCNAGRNGRKSSSLCPPGMRGESSDWPLPETTLLQVWKPQRWLISRIQIWPHFSCASEIWPQLTSYPTILYQEIFAVWITDLLWCNYVPGTVTSGDLSWGHIIWGEVSKFIDLRTSFWTHCIRKSGT